MAKKTRNRGTEEDREQRVAMARDMLSRGFTDGEITREISKKHKVASRSVDRYLTLARQELAAETGRPKTDLQNEAFARYLRIFRDPKASPRDRIRANDGIVRLFGLAAPDKLELSGGLRLEDLTDEQLLALIVRGGGPGVLESPDSSPELVGLHGVDERGVPDQLAPPRTVPPAGPDGVGGVPPGDGVHAATARQERTGEPPAASVHPGTQP